MDRVQQVRYEAYDPAKARHRRQQSAQQLQTQAGSSGSNASSVSSPPAASPSTSRSGSAAQLRTLGNGSPQSAGTGAARGAGAAPSAVRRLGSSSSSSAAPASAAAATAAAAGDAPDTPSTPSKTSNNGIRVFVDGHSTPEYPRSATASPARVASPVGGATSPPPPGPSASSSYSSEAQGPSPRTSRPSTPVSYAQTGPAPATPPKPYQQGQSRGESPSASAAPSRTPYHARFQPPGVRRDRTDEFLTLRKAKGESKKLEDGRLARRLEKLVALHFPPPEHILAALSGSAATGGVNEKGGSGAAALLVPPSVLQTVQTLNDFGDALKGKSPVEFWKAVARGRGEIDKDAEQSIVRWQDDASAKDCPICGAQFGLRTRRHHCRLCGRVVCFLPPSSSSALRAAAAAPAGSRVPPVRRVRCSTFITYEYDEEAVAFTAQSAAEFDEKRPSGQVVEVWEEPDDDPGPDPLAEKSAAATANGAKQPSKQQKVEEKAKDERKRVRVCRQCLDTVLWQQDQDRPVPTPTWLKLHRVLMQLEREIDETLPEFQELVINMHTPASESFTPRSSQSSARALRQRLTTSLASYDTLSKRILQLPVEADPLTPKAPPGQPQPLSQQQRVQASIASRAQLFLSDKLGILRTLGRMDDERVAAERKQRKEEQRLQASRQSSSASSVIDMGPGAGALLEGHQTRTLASLSGKDSPAKSATPPPLTKAQLEERSKQLAVLLEQESLVQGYVEDAHARRQFDDAASLKASLDDLRSEIDRLKNGAA